MNFAFAVTFLAVIAATLILFALGELFEAKRNTYAAMAAVCEAIVFIMLAWPLGRTHWGGIPSEIFVIVCVGGAGFSLRMAYKRWAGKVL